MNEPRVTAALQKLVDGLERVKADLDECHAALQEPDDGPPDLAHAVQRHVLLESATELFEQLAGKFARKG